MLKVETTWRFYLLGPTHPGRRTGHINEMRLQLETLVVLVPNLLDASVHPGNDDIVPVTVTILADSPAEALKTAESCIRSAIHAAGGSTADWEPTQATASDEQGAADGTTLFRWVAETRGR